jgi:hypothetical protein
VRTVTVLLLGSLVLVFAALAGAACMPQPVDPDEGQFGGTASRIETVDALDGAYIKQGGTPVFFVFRRGKTKNDSTYFGEIDVDGGDAQRASGNIAVGRDGLGPLMTLTMTGSESGATTPTQPAEGDPDAAPADLQAADTRSLVEQAFSGTVHFLKIGKNQTILVRGDTNGKTAQYTKVKTWCRADDDCSPDVQNTGLSCGGSKKPTCTNDSTCACH